MREMSQSQLVSELESVSEAVVHAVADAEGIEPAELTTPLYEAVDPEALDRFFSKSSSEGSPDRRVTFPYSGYEVTVNGEGAVSVASLDV